jgi:hypothetical protein
MLNLKQGLDHDIELDGAVYPMDLSYDNVLRWYDLVKDEDLTELEKIVIAFKMFIPDCPNNVSMDIRVATVESIAIYLVNKDEDDDEQPQEDLYEEDNLPKEFFSFDEDANYIYASFMQEYGIDLIDQRGKLAWEKFIALLNGMRSNTKFNEIVSIRATELPTGNDDASKAERERLIRLKEVYRLKSSVSVVEQEIDNMFASIMQQAIIKKGGQSNE